MLNSLRVTPRSSLSHHMNAEYFEGHSQVITFPSRKCWTVWRSLTGHHFPITWMLNSLRVTPKSSLSHHVNAEQCEGHSRVITFPSRECWTVWGSLPGHHFPITWMLNTLRVTPRSSLSHHVYAEQIEGHFKVITFPITWILNSNKAISQNVSSSGTWC